MLSVADALGEMGLAPGGKMRQEIYEDDYGFAVWERSVKSRFCFVHIVNSLQYRAVTGQNPPTRPPTAEDYTDEELPWFDYYNENLRAVSEPRRRPNRLNQLESLATLMPKKGLGDLPDNAPVAPKHVVKIGKHTSVVKEGDF